MEDTGKKNPLRELSKGSPESGYRYFEIFQRNIGIFTEAQQNVLKNSTVLIAGTGGVGSPCAEILVRMGIGNLILAEFDTFSISNLNRQIPSTVKNIGKHKAEVLAEHLKEIHPFTDIIVVSEGISSANVDKLVGESDIVISSVDSCMIMVLQEALKRNRIMGLTASPLIDEITMTSFPPGGYYFSDIYPFDVDEDDMRKSNSDYHAFVEVMSKKKLFQYGYFPVICAGTFTSAGMIAYQVADYLIYGKVFFPAFPAHAILNPQKMQIKVKCKHLKAVFRIFRAFPYFNRLFVNMIKSKVARRSYNP